MNNKNIVRKLVITLSSISVSMAAISLSPDAYAQDAAHREERIGIYDSRAVTVAYVGSPYLEDRMKQLKAEATKARVTKDAKAASRLEAQGRAWQTRLNEQGFGTAPVDDILVHIAGELPKIQEASGTKRLISKWNETELRKHPASERVDVTMALVDAFHPSAAQRDRAIEIQKLEPRQIVR